MSASATSRKRIDALGRAYAGSQLQMQIYASRRETELSQAVLGALRGLGERFDAVRWVAPLEATRFYEPRDGAFLAALGLSNHREKLSTFWPSRGPRWDALAVLEPGNGVLLVEGKSYPAEFLGGGCKAVEPAKSRIKKALDAAKSRFNVHADADSLERLYQSAISRAFSSR